MAVKGYVVTLLNTLPPEIQRPLQAAFDYVQDNWRLGSGTRASNAQWYRVTATTDPTANTEFSVKHGLDGAPITLIPILDLTAVGAQLVPLQVSRAPDGARVYLKSTSTSAAITFYVE